jgi:hypothetical protein
LTVAASSAGIRRTAPASDASLGLFGSFDKAARSQRPPPEHEVAAERLGPSF